MLLTEDRSSARDFHKDVYAWKLAWTSSSRLSDIVLVMWVSTISPVMANSTVTATEVESRIFHNSDNRENQRGIIWALPDTCRRWKLAGSHGRICRGAAREQTRFRKWKSTAESGRPRAPGCGAREPAGFPELRAREKCGAGNRRRGRPRC